MKSVMNAVYSIINDAVDNSFTIYPVKRTATDPDFPYIVFNVSSNDENSLIYRFTVTVDIYDRQSSADTVLTAVEEIMKELDRQCIDTDAQVSISRFENSGFIPEDDREVWHWSGDFEIRSDKKAIIGGK